MKEKPSRKSLGFLLLVTAAILLSVWGPEALTVYKDKAILNRTHEQEAETAGEGYRYTLSAEERLYILSQCLNSQTLPESEQSALARAAAQEVEYQDLAGTYAFVVNHRGPTGKEITDQEIYDTCSRQLRALKELGILPESVRETEQAAYDAVLYSAIDVLEPRNNVAVWKLSLSDSQKNADKQNRLIDAYVDADSGKLYEFYVRTSLSWKEVDPDALAEKWSGYLGLGKPVPYEPDNPLLETTPYFKKYEFSGMGEDKTVVTIGFYEGINELFLKISK